MSSYSKPGVTTKKQSGSNNPTGTGVFVNVGIVGQGSGGISLESKTVVRAASATKDFVDSSMSSAEVSYMGAKYVPGVDFEITDAGEIQWKDTKLPSPYVKKVTPVISAGSLASGTYYYAVTAIKRITANTYGETLISNVMSGILNSAGKITVQWGQVELAEGYRIYRGTSATVLTRIRELVGANAVTWDDTGVYSPSITTPPVTNNCLRRPPSSIADTAGYWTGADASANLAGIKAVSAGSVGINADSRGAIQVSGMDFSGAADLAACATILQVAARSQLGDRGYAVSADASLNLSNLKSVTAGALKIALDGGADISVSSINLSSVTTFEDVAALLQAALRTATSRDVIVAYDSATGLFTISSPLRGSVSACVMSAPDSGIDLTGATYLNFVNGASVAGVNYAISVAYEAVAKTFVLTSATAGSTSSVVITAGTAGTDATTAGTLAIASGAGGSGTIGTSGDQVTYDALATMRASNYFEAETFFDLLLLGNTHGTSSLIYETAVKMMSVPPRGFAAKQLTVVATDSSSRAAIASALEELAKVDVDIVCAVSNDIDVARDIVNHAVYCSQDSVKKERVAIVALDSSRISYSAFVSLASEFSSYEDRVILVYDNISTEPYIAPLVAAFAASMPDRATSMIAKPFITTLPFLKTPRVDGNSETFLLSSGVLVVGKDEAGAYTVIDDVACGGPSFDMPGRLVEDQLRKDIRIEIYKKRGRKKTALLAENVREICNDILDKYQFSELISSWDESSLKVSNDPDDSEAYVINFEYTRMNTFKRATVSYSVVAA